jgi:hypothetical protein
MPVHKQQQQQQRTGVSDGRMRSIGGRPALNLGSSWAVVAECPAAAGVVLVLQCQL